MADEKKIIEVEVREKGLDELNRDLKQNEQQLKDNGGAIAILDELTGGLATKFRDAAEASKLFGQVSKAAIASTGIGLLVAAVSTVALYWDEIVEFVTEANKRLEQQIRISQNRQTQLEYELELLQKQLDLAELRGEATEGLLLAQEKMIRLQILEKDNELSLLNLKLAGLQAAAQEITIRERIAGFVKGGIGGLLTGDLEDFKELADVQGAIQEATLAAADLDIALETVLNRLNPKEDPADPDKPPSPDKVTGETRGVITGLNLDVLSETIDIEAGLINEARRSDERERIAKSRRDRQLAEADAQFQLDMLREIATGLAGFSALAGQQTGVGKALAVAAASINTGVAVTEALKAPGIPNALRIAQAVAIGAFGLAQVKDILSVQVPDATLQSPLIRGGGGSGTSTPAIQQPSFNIVGDPGINQLQDTINAQTNEPIRAYVVSDDVRTQGELDRNIRASASL